MTYHRRRYRDDPEYRLHKVNYNRRRRGLPLASHVNEINVNYGAHARRRQRDERGRFV